MKQIFKRLPQVWLSGYFIDFACIVQPLTLYWDYFVLELLWTVCRIDKLFFFLPHRLRRLVDMLFSLFKLSLICLLALMLMCCHPTGWRFCKFYFSEKWRKATKTCLCWSWWFWNKGTEPLYHAAHLSLKHYLDYFVSGITLILWQPTVECLQQGYCVIPSEKRFLVLYAFLRMKVRQKQKVMVFFSSCSSVKFHAEVLNFLRVQCDYIHGQMKQQKRTSTFFRFKEEKGILLCTNVAARGLDIPNVVRFCPVFFKPCVLLCTSLIPYVKFCCLV